MAARKRRRSRSKQEYPGWLWMLFGLSIGLSVAFAVYVKDRGSESRPVIPEPASLQNALDDNGELHRLGLLAPGDSMTVPRR